MNIFTVLSIWSNTDPSVISFESKTHAIEYAKQSVANSGWPVEDIEISEYASIYGASLGEEGDYIFVMETVLKCSDDEDCDNELSKDAHPSQV